MVCTRGARAGIVLLALQRALTVLVALVILLFLVARLVPGPQLPTDESGPSGAAVAGGDGGPAAESDSPGPYMTFDLFWELPAQGPNVSEASSAGLKNETGLANNSRPLTERPEFITLLKGALPVLESELVDKEAPEEGQQAEPVPGGSSETLQPTPGVVKRFNNAEDAKAGPNTAEVMASTGTDDDRMIWSAFLRAFLLSVHLSLIALLLLKVAPAWAEDIKERLTALRAKTGDKDFVVEV